MAVAHDVQVSRLLEWYGRAGEDVKAEGRGWYDASREIVRELAARYGLEAETVAAAMAALSPMTRWPENVAGTIRLLRAWDAGDESPPRNCTLFYKNAMKAWWILADTSPALVFKNSPKVFAFWRNLCGDEQAVTVDTWMLRAVGEDAAARSGAKPATVRRVSDAVREAALRVAETPAQFQAIVWVGIRRELARIDTTKEAA
jgi:hypothetical protein